MGGSYVRNADLTLEYIVKRAFRLGALSAYSDIQPGHDRVLVIEWPCDGKITYGVELYESGKWAHSLRSLRRGIENQGIWEKLHKPKG